jgi:prepilin-type N-terminal cleavage/methylation domain-containing protein
MRMTSKALRGFTVIEILAVVVILGTLLALCLSRYVTLQDDAAYLVVQQAKNELDLREHIAWAKYRAGSMTWGDLQNGGEITGGTEGLGDFRVTDGALMGNANSSVCVHITRKPPSREQPGRWILDK